MPCLSLLHFVHFKTKDDSVEVLVILVILSSNQMKSLLSNQKGSTREGISKDVSGIV